MKAWHRRLAMLQGLAGAVAAIPMVREHGGRIGVDTMVGRGRSFSIYLPPAVG